MMTDQQQRTQWALDTFRSFATSWAPRVMMEDLTSPWHSAIETVNRSIRAIAPKDDSKAIIGYGVFQREIDADWDIRQHPSGFVHTLISAVFDKPHFAENAHQGASKRHPERQYVICEIREVP